MNKISFTKERVVVFLVTMWVLINLIAFFSFEYAVGDYEYEFMGSFSFGTGLLFFIVYEIIVNYELMRTNCDHPAHNKQSH